MDESEEYVDMCQAIREIREEGREEGRQEARQEVRKRENEIILRMLRKGMFKYEEIAELVGVPVDKVKAMGIQIKN